MRERLHSEEFDHAWQAGAAMSIQQATAEASAFLDRVRSPAIATDRARAPSPFGLTSRELDVLRLLAAGKSDREIADMLFIGLRTVETHVSNVLAKLGAHNRAEATAFAIRSDLV